MPCGLCSNANLTYVVCWCFYLVVLSSDLIYTLIVVYPLLQKFNSIRIVLSNVSTITEQ